ncbi:hypothetical protein BDF22DRAFT_668177 [Syncephalis plumigaleata]|nr:hypothetical protein BDF22DRAFT_668177 [Syncephalis plumigaleata]
MPLHPLAPMVSIDSNTNFGWLCRLSKLFVALPAHDRNYTLSLLSHTDLVQLSVCCRLLRNVIRNDIVLWREVYRRKFLSDAYYKKEWEFVLWCIRTTADNSNKSQRRMAMLKGIDWYDIYRRRVATENSWRFGNATITHIDLELRACLRDMERLRHVYVHSTSATGVLLKEKYYDNSDNELVAYYNLEYLAHLDLEQFNGKTDGRSLSVASNAILQRRGSNASVDYSHPVLGDHYIVARQTKGTKHQQPSMAVFSHGHDAKLGIIDVSHESRIVEVSGKWALLVECSQELSHQNEYVYANITVVDMDHGVKYPSVVDGTWNAVCFHETNDATATVYTSRLVKNTMGNRLEWALYRFSSKCSMKRIQSGWFSLPEFFLPNIKEVYPLHQSQVVVELFHLRGIEYIIHSVASSGQGNMPKNTFRIYDKGIPLPLLQEGLRCPASSTANIYCDHPVDDSQFLRIPGVFSYRHIIGNLYCIRTCQDTGLVIHLVDITTKDIIRTISNPDELNLWRQCLMTGPITQHKMTGTDNAMLIMQSHGAL